MNELKAEINSLKKDVKLLKYFVRNNLIPLMVENFCEDDCDNCSLDDYCSLPREAFFEYN